MENLAYTALAEQTAEAGWSAHLPDLPTILVVGKSLEELERNAHDAIAIYVEEMQSMGLTIPRPATHTLRVEVAA